MADELYRGDAPVSLPGVGGATPRPYETRHTDEHHASHADTFGGVNATAGGLNQTLGEPLGFTYGRKQETINGRSAAGGTLAFDTAATSGEIILRDDAGRDVITWPVSLDEQ